MDDEYRVGLHRLTRRFEDPVELFVATALFWALVVILIAVAFVLPAWMWLLLIAAGVGVLFLFRDRLADAAAEWRRERVRLEQQRGGRLAH